MDFSKITKFWFLNQSLDQIVIVAANIFVDFYIWETTGDINKILEFNLGLFLLLPVGNLLAGIFSEYASLKISFISAKIVHICYLALLMVFGGQLISSVFIFGVLSGFVTGLVVSNEEILTEKIDKQEKAILAGKLAASKRFFSIITPLGLALLIDKSSASFDLGFGIAAIVIVILLIAGILTDFPVLDGSFSLGSIFSFPGDNPEKGFLASSSFLNGIKEGFHYSLIGVLTLSFAGSLINWSFINISMSIIAIILGLVYNRFSFTRFPILSLGLGAIVFLVTSSYFSFNYSFFGILVYLAGLSIFEVFFGIGFTATTSRLTTLDASGKDLDSEYTFFISLFQSLGMIIPIAILYYLRLDLTDPIFFRILLVAISFIPFTILGKLKKSFYLTHQSTQDLEIIDANTLAEENRAKAVINQKI